MRHIDQFIANSINLLNIYRFPIPNITRCSKEFRSRLRASILYIPIPRHEPVPSDAILSFPNCMRLPVTSYEHAVNTTIHRHPTRARETLTACCWTRTDDLAFSTRPPFPLSHRHDAQSRSPSLGTFYDIHPIKDDSRSVIYFPLPVEYPINNI